jgi:hypothetical protein
MKYKLCQRLQYLYLNPQNRIKPFKTSLQVYEKKILCSTYIFDYMNLILEHEDQNTQKNYFLVPSSGNFVNMLHAMQ